MSLHLISNFATAMIFSLLCSLYTTEVFGFARKLHKHKTVSNSDLHTNHELTSEELDLYKNSFKEMDNSTDNSTDFIVGDEESTEKNISTQEVLRFARTAHKDKTVPILEGLDLYRNMLKDTDNSADHSTDIIIEDEESTEKNFNTQNKIDQLNSTLQLVERQRRSSIQICPEKLTIGQCPDLASYPNCNMLYITSACPWKILNNKVVCLTKQPCFHIDQTQPMLQCVPFYESRSQLAVACLAAKPFTEYVVG